MRPIRVIFLILVFLPWGLLLNTCADVSKVMDIDIFLKSYQIPYGTEEITEAQSIATYGNGVTKTCEGEKQHVYFDPQTQLWLQLSFNTDDQRSIPLFELLVSKIPLAGKKVYPIKAIKFPGNIRQLIGMSKKHVEERYSLRPLDVKLSRGPKIQGEILSMANRTFYIDHGEVVALSIDNLP
jgi:hypothetical protein